MITNIIKQCFIYKYNCIAYKLNLFEYMVFRNLRKKPKLVYASYGAKRTNALVHLMQNNEYKNK